MSLYRQEFHCSCSFRGPWSRNDEEPEGSWEQSNGISNCVYVFAMFLFVFSYVLHVRAPICWELRKNFSACYVMIIVFDDPWRCYGLLCQSHEECLWMLNTLVVRVKVCYLFIDVRNFGCMVVKLFCMCHKWSLKIVFLHVVVDLGCGIFHGSSMVYFNQEMTNKTNGAHQKWD